MSVPGTQLSAPPDAHRQTYPFRLADLPYAYDALEPGIDQKTLQVHHRGHHAGYVKKLNEALARHPELQRRTLDELLTGLEQIPEEIRTAVKNNGGGHLNHDFFWSVMAPAPTRPPQGALARSIVERFGSFENFRKKFSEVAGKHFASGWVALALDHGSGRLEILDLDDHEIVAPGTATGLLILDVWEHAYYVKYQDRRPEFIAAFWNIVNWARAEELYERAGSR
jgi:Fe-Mn family superoxide dismutase